jgi:hypothetical protein
MKYNKYPVPMVNTTATAKAFGRKTNNRAAFGKTNSAHPGQNMGLTLDDVKQLVDEAPKVVGTTFTSAAGTVNPNVQIPATAKYIIGFTFGGAPVATDIFDLLINEERAIDNGAVTAFAVGAGKPVEAYFPFFRPVAGATAINLNYTSLAGGATVIFQIHYV